MHVPKWSSNDVSLSLDLRFVGNALHKTSVFVNKISTWNHRSDCLKHWFCAQHFWKVLSKSTFNFLILFQHSFRRWKVDFIIGTSHQNYWCGIHLFLLTRKQMWAILVVLKWLDTLTFLKLVRRFIEINWRKRYEMSCSLFKVKILKWLKPILSTSNNRGVMLSKLTFEPRMMLKITE